MKTVLKISLPALMLLLISCGPGICTDVCTPCAGTDCQAFSGLLTATPSYLGVRNNWDGAAVSGASGYVLVRRQAKKVDWTPTGGTTYTTGQVLDANHTVLYAGPLTSTEQTGLTPGTKYYYELFGHDASMNYASVSATAHSFVGPTEVSAFGGAAQSIAVSGTHAYLAKGSRGLEVYDVSNPNAPAIVGMISGQGVCNKITVEGTYAYMGCGVTGVRIIDLSDRTDPNLIGVYDTTGSAAGVAISGDLAYVADGASGLLILNISNPESPTYVGAYDTIGVSVFVALSGNYAYVADGTAGGIVSINISNPAAPTLGSILNTPGTARRVSISGNYALVADGASGTYVANISNPLAITYQGGANWITINGHSATAIVGNIAYMAEGAGLVGGIWAVNISDMSNPAVTFNIPDSVGSINAVDVAYLDGYVYVADAEGGLVIFDSATLTQRSVFMGNNSNSYPNLHGNYAFLDSGATDATIVDLSDIRHPKYLTSFVGNGYQGRGAFSGNYYFVANGGGGNDAFDISNPASPVLLTNFGISGNDMAIAGNRLYQTSGSLRVYDISNPAAPALLGTDATYAHTYLHAPGGNFVYGGSQGSSLIYTINVSNPAAMTVNGTNGSIGLPLARTGSGTLSYTVGTNGFGIYDVSSSTATTYVGGISSATIGAANDIVVSGNYAYVTTGATGVRVIDVTNPASPLLVYTLDTTGNAWGIDYKDGAILVSDTSALVVIMGLPGQ